MCVPHQSCATCQFYLEWAGTDEGSYGVCRRRSPVANAPTAVGFPVTYPANWCGEWEWDVPWDPTNVVWYIDNRPKGPTKPRASNT